MVIFMKIRKLFALTFLAATIGIVCAANTLTSEDNNQQYESVSAANVTSGTLLFLKPNSNWTQANARFAAYFCNGSSAAAWADMTDKDGDGIYSVIVPGTNQSHKNVIFCRMNPSTTDNNWNNKWNQTGDLNWDGTKNLCTINDGQWDCGTNVTWSTQSSNAIAKGTEIFIEFNDNWSGDNAALCVYSFDAYGTEADQWLTPTQLDGSDIYKVIAPYYSVIILTRSDPNKKDDWSSVWNQSENIYASATSGSNYIAASGFANNRLAFNFNTKFLYSNVESWADGLVGKCGDGSGTNSTYNWSSLKTKYNALTSGEKHLLQTATINENGSKIQKALSIYKFLVESKKEVGFFDRADITAAKRISFFNSANSANEFGVVIIITAILISTSLILVKKAKKKENN